MPPYWTMEEVENSIRSQGTFEGIAELFNLFFRVRGHELDNFLKATAFFDRMRSGEDMSPLEKFDFSTFITTFPASVTTKHFSDEETELYERIMDETERMDMSKLFQSEGEAFYKEKISIPSGTVAKIQEQVAGLKDLEERASRDVSAKTFVRAMESMKHDPRFEKIINMPREGRANWNKANDAYDALYKEHRKKVVAELERDLPYYEELSDLRKVVSESSADVYAKVVDAIFDASPVTAEMAQEWAENNVYMHDNAQRKLNKSQYKIDDLRRDMATIYRLLGGKLGPVEFILEGRGQRAHAKGRFQVSVNGDFNKETLFHEVGHLVEHWDSAFQKACEQFIEGRATGKPKRLSVLTGQKGYRTDEIAYPDSFIHPYVGKIYQGGSSEVFSMCLQQLVAPAKLVELMAKDPEHFNILLAFCIRKNPALAEEAKKIQEETTVKATEQEAKRAVEKAWKKELGKVASGALFDLLCQEDGWEGYKLDKYGNKYIIKALDSNKWIPLTFLESKTDATRKAYLLIANNKDLLPALYDESETSKLLNLAVTVPYWFTDKSQKLPRII